MADSAHTVPIDVAGRSSAHGQHVQIPNTRLRDARFERNWSQKELAIRLGTTFNNVSRWELGKTVPDLYFRGRLCDLFGTTAEALGLVEAAVRPLFEAPATSLLPFVYDASIPLALLGPGQLLGREALLQALKSQVCAERHPAITVLRGLPGIGKTALAVEIASDPEIQEHFRDGILWAGLGPEPSVRKVLIWWNRLLGSFPSDNSIESLATTLRVGIGARQMLIVIDDAWSLQDVLTLRVGGPGCVYLVTTRFPSLAAYLVGNAAVAVPELSEEDGVRLLTTLAPVAVSYDQDTAGVLVRAVKGLPLALVLMGNFLRGVSHADQPRRIRAAFDVLQDSGERIRLAEPQAPSEHHPSLSAEMWLSVESLIEVSIRYLDGPVQHGLHVLSVSLPRTDSFTLDDALLAGVQDAEVLDRLSDAGLLESRGPDRYALHPVIADYARLQVQTSTSIKSGEQRVVSSSLHTMPAQPENNAPRSGMNDE